MKTLVMTFCCAVLAGSVVHQQAAAWYGITPLHSLRADVERILGKPSGTCLCEYKRDGDLVRVDYAGSPCGDEKAEHWNVRPDTVLTVTIHPKMVSPFANYSTDSGTLAKTDDPELKGYAIYSSDTDGIAYHVTDEGKVFMIMYYGSSKDRTALRCK